MVSSEMVKFIQRGFVMKRIVLCFMIAFTAFIGCEATGGTATLLANPADYEQLKEYYNTFSTLLQGFTVVDSADLVNRLQKFADWTATKTVDEVTAKLATPDLVQEAVSTILVDGVEKVSGVNCYQAPYVALLEPNPRGVNNNTLITITIGTDQITNAQLTLIDSIGGQSTVPMTLTKVGANTFQWTAVNMRLVGLHFYTVTGSYILDGKIIVMQPVSFVFDMY